MKKFITIVTLSILAALILSGSVFAQTSQPTLSIRVSRDFGYAGFSRDIQGTFSIHVSGPNNLTRVEFYLDDTLMGTDIESPYALSFQTGDYDLGWHDIYAIGVLDDGTQIRSETVTREFVEPKDMLKFVIPVLAVVLLITVLSAVGPAMMGRKGNFEVGKYGVAGGSVCKRCGFPYSRPILGINMGLGRLQRCPHCGKWEVAMRAPAQSLKEAEERYLAAQNEEGTIKVDEKDDLRRSLDDSRYDD